MDPLGMLSMIAWLADPYVGVVVGMTYGFTRGCQPLMTHLAGRADARWLTLVLQNAVDRGKTPAPG